MRPTDLHWKPVSLESENEAHTPFAASFPKKSGPMGFSVWTNENNGKTSDVLALPLQGDRKPLPVANSPFSENNNQRC
jgi:hypothetical protein